MVEPGEFIAVAERLAIDPSEAGQRSAISRAYYGAFLHLREAALDRGDLEPSRSGSVHSQVHAITTSWNRRHAAWLKTLREMRNTADYDIHQAVSDEAAVYAIDLARRILRFQPPA
ncbi:MAG: hypothetical protein U5Q44_10605 [Dehalococcoidia bacterium]|nr:hypothetical protein [Dehalococcoidia bacterium]